MKKAPMTVVGAFSFVECQRTVPSSQGNEIPLHDGFLICSIE